MTRRLIGATAIVVASMSAASAASPAAPNAATPFARYAEVQGVRLSPDGDRVALSVQRPGENTMLSVVQLDGLKPIGSYAVNFDRDIADVYWVNDERLMFGTAYHLGTGEAPVRSGQLFSVVIGEKRLRDISPSDPRSRDWSIVDLGDGKGTTVLMRIWSGGAPYLWRYNLDTERTYQLWITRTASGWLFADHHSHVRLQGGTERDGTAIMLARKDEDASWKELSRIPVDSDEAISPATYTADDARILLYDNRTPTGTTGLVEFDPATSTSMLRFVDPDHDVVGLIQGRTPGTPAGVVLAGDRLEWRFFDPSAEESQLLASIRTMFAGQEVALTSWSRDRSRVVVSVWSDVDPGGYYVLDLAQRKLIARFAREPWIDPSRMAHMTPVTFKARDGLELHAYLTEPAQGSRHKLVVYPHGGPLGIRDDWGYDSEVQWLAANGYSVLQVNYRGSSGYGRTFQAAGKGRWGTTMQDDITDATHWAIDGGVADADKVCIYGASYGGYAALMGAVREPTLYRCAVGYAGVYDLKAIRADGELFNTAPGRAYERELVGDDPEELLRRSPSRRAAEIRIPVFLAHGGEDDIAPPEQYDAMLSALKSAHKQVQTLYKDHEAHGFAKVENREEFMQKLIEFLDANTGGPAH